MKLKNRKAKVKEFKNKKKKRSFEITDSTIVLSGNQIIISVFLLYDKNKR